MRSDLASRLKKFPGVQESIDVKSASLQAKEIRDCSDQFCRDMHCYG